MSQSISLSFTEVMRGSLTKNNRDWTFPLTQAQYSQSSDESQLSCEFTLTIEISDIEKFCLDPSLLATAVGTFNLPELDMQEVPVRGLFNLFTRPQVSQELNTSSEMHYILNFESSNHESYTLFGFKNIEREDLAEAWSETTTLYVTLYKGNFQHLPTEGMQPQYLGVLRIQKEDFINQIKTFKTDAPDFVTHVGAIAKFMNLFVGRLWDSYAPFFFGTDQNRWNERLIPLESRAGVSQARFERHSIWSQDGLHLQIDRFYRSKNRNVVLLLHGLTTSTDMFIMPEHYNLVQYLLNNGYEDVWSFDWRGSLRYSYNLKPYEYNLDYVASYDIPKAIELMRSQLGEDVAIHVICHCVGSISFMSSLAAGKIKGIRSIISNSVSLTPQVPWQSRLKLQLGPFILKNIMGYPYISPEMPYFNGVRFGKWIFWMERLLRRECREPACHMVSFMWGWGFPAAFEHENLNPITHRRLKDLFGSTSLDWYKHILKMVKSKQALPFRREGEFSDLPESYLGNLKDIELPPLLLVSGDKNKIFPQSNKITYEALVKMNLHSKASYKEFKGYGHQDVLMGRNSHEDIFPNFLNFMNSNKLK